MQGIAVGRMYLYRKADYHAAAQKASDPEAERARFLATVEEAKAPLRISMRKRLSIWERSRAAEDLTPSETLKLDKKKF